MTDQTRRFVDVTVAVVGDGPAGTALASALTAREVDVALVGPDSAWSATYGAWVDDITEVRGWSEPIVSSVGEIIAGLRVVGESERSVGRPYVVFDNGRLRSRLRHGVRHVVGTVSSVDARVGGVELSLVRRAESGSEGAGVTESARLRADVVFDATGWPSRLVPGSPRPMGWQTAWGAVLAEPPSGPLGTATLMDFSSPGDAAGASAVTAGVPTFAYALPVADGWLVEETVLASETAIEPEQLRSLLADRLGWSVDELLERAQRVETVEIPMGAPMRRPESRNLVVPFGAAAGLAHPATGYQVATSLRLAPRVADAFAAAHGAGLEPATVARAAWDAVWPTPQRRTRRLHEYGLDVVMRLDTDATRQFFETFFALPAPTWSVQMRSDVTPRQVVGVMTRMFVSATWSLRRRLMSGDLRRLASALRS